MKGKTLYSDVFNDTSTCISLDLPICLCCDKCNREKDPLRRKMKRNDDFIVCEQLWSSKYAEKRTTQGKIMMHNRIRNYFNVALDVELDFVNLKGNKNG